MSSEEKDNNRKKFRKIVGKIKTQSSIIRQGKNVECFISYAWDKDTLDFVKNELVHDIEYAGINVIVDYKNLSIGQNVVDHESKIRNT